MSTSHRPGFGIDYWLFSQFIYRLWLRDQSDSKSIQDRLIPNLKRVYAGRPGIMRHMIGLAEIQVRKIDNPTPADIRWRRVHYWLFNQFRARSDLRHHDNWLVLENSIIPAIRERLASMPMERDHAINMVRRRIEQIGVEQDRADERAEKNNRRG